MAFASKDLSALVYSNGFTLWHYKTADTAATVDTAGYFNSASTMLRVGDFVILNAGVGGTPGNGLVVVLSNAAGVVDTGDMLNAAAADTD